MRNPLAAITVIVAALGGAGAGYFTAGLIVQSVMPEAEWQVVLAVWMGAIVGALLTALVVAARLRGRGDH